MSYILNKEENKILNSIKKEVKSKYDLKIDFRSMKFLKSGGRLVGICANGPRQAEKIKPLCNYWQVLPRDTFKNCDTKVSSILFKIESGI